MTHKDLDIWKLGIELVEKVYKMTAEYPKEEMELIEKQRRKQLNFIKYLKSIQK